MGRGSSGADESSVMLIGDRVLEWRIPRIGGGPASQAHAYTRLTSWDQAGYVTAWGGNNSRFV